MSDRLLQLLRFCAVGITCFFLGLAILAGLHELAGVNYLVAYVVSFVVTNFTGYLLNARFTFSLRSVARAGVIRYMLVNGALLCANALALKLLVDVLHVWYLAAAAVLALINAPVSFLGQWLFTYRIMARNATTAA
jgi:putative flippase GtrA